MQLSAEPSRGFYSVKIRLISVNETLKPAFMTFYDLILHHEQTEIRRSYSDDDDIYYRYHLGAGNMDKECDQHQE